jgi:hypothetical protein
VTKICAGGENMLQGTTIVLVIVHRKVFSKQERMCIGRKLLNSCFGVQFFMLFSFFLEFICLQDGKPAK